MTPGSIDLEKQMEALRRLDLPPVLDGLTVLDVGCWGGFYSFECERRGAARILATDRWVWERAWGMDGFLTARRLLNSKVEYMKIDPHDISKEKMGEFDIVLFLGVYYHLRDPLAVLDRLAEVARRQIIVETAVIHTPGEEGVPLSRFLEGMELNRDFSNWWVPNVECLVQTVRSAGFSRVDVVYDPWSRARLRSFVKDYAKRMLSPLVPPRLRHLENDRAVVHGFKRHTYTSNRNFEGEVTHEQLRRIVSDSHEEHVTA